MEKSILASVKKVLGIHKDDESFDLDLILAINTAIGILRQIGVRETPFTIESDDETWEDYLGEDKTLEDVKTYICQKVRLIFDPPQNSSVTESINKTLTELECRISYEVDPGKEET